MTQSAIKAMRWFREVSVHAKQAQLAMTAPNIDIDQLLLALLEVPGVLSQLARDHRLGVSDFREALGTVTQDDLRTLGVTIERPFETAKNAGRGSLDTLIWAPRARQLLEASAREDHPDVHLLRTLISEPTGRIRSTFAILSLDEAEIHARMECATHEESESLNSPRKNIEGSDGTSTVVPYELREVWQLISIPERWSRWNSMTYENERVIDGGVLADYRETRADGMPTRVPKNLKETRWRLIKAEEPRTVIWEYCHTARPERLRRLRIDLRVVPTGTEIVVALTSRPSGSFVRRSLRVIQAPLRSIAYRQAQLDILDNIRYALAAGHAVTTP